MQTDKKEHKTRETVETVDNMFSRCMPAREAMPDFCSNMAETDDCCSMMRKGMKLCRWFPAIPVVLGIVLFLLGYYLDAETTRVLWMALAVLVTVMGTLGLIIAGLMKKMCCG